MIEAQDPTNSLTALDRPGVVGRDAWIDESIAQRLMWALGVVVPGVLENDVPKMSLATCPKTRTSQIRVGIALWRADEK